VHTEPARGGTVEEDVREEVQFEGKGREGGREEKEERSK